MKKVKTSQDLRKNLLERKGKKTKPNNPLGTDNRDNAPNNTFVRDASDGIIKGNGSI